MCRGANLFQNLFRIEPPLHKRAVPLILAAIARVYDDGGRLVAVALIDFSGNDLIIRNELEFEADVVYQHGFCEAEGADDFNISVLHFAVETPGDFRELSVTQEFVNDRVLSRITRPDRRERSEEE